MDKDKERDMDKNKERERERRGDAAASTTGGARTPIDRRTPLKTSTGQAADGLTPARILARLK